MARDSFGFVFIVLRHGGETRLVAEQVPHYFWILRLIQFELLGRGNAPLSYLVVRHSALPERELRVERALSK